MLKATDILCLEKKKLFKGITLAVNTAAVM